MLEKLGDELQHFFWRIDYSKLESLQESCTSKMLCRTYSVFRRRFADSLKKQGQPRIRCAGKSLAVEGGSRLHESEERRSRRR